MAMLGDLRGTYVDSQVLGNPQYVNTKGSINPRNSWTKVCLSRIVSHCWWLSSLEMPKFIWLPHSMTHQPLCLNNRCCYQDTKSLDTTKALSHCEKDVPSTCTTAVAVLSIMGIGMDLWIWCIVMHGQARCSAFQPEHIEPTQIIFPLEITQCWDAQEKMTGFERMWKQCQWGFDSYPKPYGIIWMHDCISDPPRHTTTAHVFKEACVGYSMLQYTFWRWPTKSLPTTTIVGK